ncbi:hypothetical protein A0J57_18230 [Sphingobium sp. 22B]|uniref:hypothetical protein n=1 Tax=unclassified Sphingobium TaxID=2611147 RepID=UPI000781602D|nr:MULTISPECIES: hypothetical protein [unclassified Sphingobium]KXU29218.1 hypothetical protein AXW74_24200 [Sphingobium sp. AM]KYC30930.1 hypothetical protein A0J57_18230 [Sphingobium sp. 22B]OAP30462.1 hypothetical protein A8O16_18520 [Sphingobium sp. 20006FA]
MTAIDLEELTGAGKVHNLSGRERGLAARELFKLDQLDADAQPVDVLVPDYVYSLTPSFVQGFFGASVKAFGYDTERFKSHFRFKAPSIVMQQLERGLAAITTQRDLRLL